jgi:hypothetical protein
MPILRAAAAKLPAKAMACSMESASGVRTSRAVCMVEVNLLNYFE